MALLTAQELARELKVTVDTVWRYTRKGKIPSLRLGPRDYRYSLEDVLAALASTPPADSPVGEGGRGEIRLKTTTPRDLRAFAGEVPGVEGDGR
mgnify:CR=1 FL=1